MNRKGLKFKKAEETTDGKIKLIFKVLGKKEEAEWIIATSDDYLMLGELVKKIVQTLAKHNMHYLRSL